MGVIEFGDEAGIGGAQTAARQRRDPVRPRQFARDDFAAEYAAQRFGDVKRGIAARPFDMNEARRFLAPIALANGVQRSAGLTSFYFVPVAPTTVSHCLAMTSLAAFCSSSVGNFALA